MVSLAAEEERQGDIRFPPVGSPLRLWDWQALCRGSLCVTTTVGAALTSWQLGFLSQESPQYLPGVVCSKIRKLETGA